MSARREILYLSHRIPYPPDKGDKIRSWRFVSHLARRFDVHLACFVDDPADQQHVGLLNEIVKSGAYLALDATAARLRAIRSLLAGEPFTFGYYRTAIMRARIEAMRRRDLAAEIAFSSSMAPYLSNPVPGRPRVVDLCDADSEKWGAYASTAAPPMKWIYRREFATLSRAETRLVNEFDATLTISEAEAAVLRGRAGIKRPVRIVGNGVDADYFSPARDYGSPEGAADIVFVGAMDYRPNAEAAAWLVSQVWPQIRKRAPAGTLAIIGPRPSSNLLKAHGKDGIAVTGRVDDVRPYLHGAKVVAAPLSIARGVQNKVLEAMAMAKAVVATTAANTGIEAVSGREILIADEPAAFTDCVIGLMANAERRRAIGEAARRRILGEFSWERQLARFDEALLSAGVGA